METSDNFTNKILCGDCLELIKILPGESVGSDFFKTHNFVSFACSNFIEHTLCLFSLKSHPQMYCNYQVKI